MASRVRGEGYATRGAIGAESFITHDARREAFLQPLEFLQLLEIRTSHTPLGRMPARRGGWACPVGRDTHNQRGSDVRN